MANSQLLVYLSTLPSDIIFEILLCAAYDSREFARSLSLVSSWANNLAQQALFSTISLVHIGELRTFFNALGLTRDPFPKRVTIINLFRLSFKEIPELSPSQHARTRARLIHNLWFIPLDGQDHATLEDHVYMRLALQLCANIKSLALMGTTFSHFLGNKANHFRDVRNEGADEVGEDGWSPYPHLTHLTLIDSTPSSIMERHYARAEECVRVFKQITHFTAYGFYHRNGLPIALHNFASLTHVALPLILHKLGVDVSSPSEVFRNTGGWQLLQSTPQIQMIVFLFPPDGGLYIGDHRQTDTRIYQHPPTLILTANRLNHKAYALPVDGLRGLHRQWYSAVRGGPSIWDLAVDTLRRYATAADII